MATVSRKLKFNGKDRMSQIDRNQFLVVYFEADPFCSG